MVVSVLQYFIKLLLSFTLIFGGIPSTAFAQDLSFSDSDNSANTEVSQDVYYDDESFNNYDDDEALFNTVSFVSCPANSSTLDLTSNDNGLSQRLNYINNNLSGENLSDSKNNAEDIEQGTSLHAIINCANNYTINEDNILFSRSDNGENCKDDIDISNFQLNDTSMVASFDFYMPGYSVCITSSATSTLSSSVTSTPVSDDEDLDKAVVFVSDSPFSIDVTLIV